jgi:hypothetical protein
MPTYRVTYTDSVLREAVVEAGNADDAEDLVRGQIDSAEHHHAVDAWNDDWQAEPCTRQSRRSLCCFECGQIRE